MLKSQVSPVCSRVTSRCVWWREPGYVCMLSVSLSDVWESDLPSLAPLLWEDRYHQCTQTPIPDCNSQDLTIAATQPQGQYLYSKVLAYTVKQPPAAGEPCHLCNTNTGPPSHPFLTWTLRKHCEASHPMLGRYRWVRATSDLKCPEHVELLSQLPAAQTRH